MSKLTTAGRLFYTLAITLIGIQFIIYTDFNSPIMPLPIGLGARNLWMRLLGTVMLVCGLGMGIEKKGEWAAIVLALLFFTLFLIVHLPKIIAQPKDGGAWTGAFEWIALAAGALIHGRSMHSQSGHQPGPGLLARLVSAGAFIFGISLFIFGLQHFIYADFIAQLVPSWAPLHLFWAYAVGVLFFLFGISIVFRRNAYVGALCLALMFLTWLLFLHAPRVVAEPHNDDEWTSGFIAMAMCGIGFMLAGSFIKPVPQGMTRTADSTF